LQTKGLLEELKEKKITECPGMNKSGPKQNIFEFEVKILVYLYQNKTIYLLINI
jgi:hypothetical protein